MHISHAAVALKYHTGFGDLVQLWARGLYLNNKLYDS